MLTWDDSLEDERRRWVLALFQGLSTSQVVDQIRVMKGMFLLSMASGHPVHDRQMYDFEPYVWGPFDSRVYRDIDALVGRELLHAERQRGSYQIRYSLTSSGQAEATRFVASLPPHLQTLLTSVRERVVSPSVRDLLEDIYAEYPSYAVNSRLR